MISRLSTVALSLALMSGLALAQMKMDGQFVASKACPAVVSIKKGTNPGDVSVEAGKSYSLLGKNKDQASHYWVNVPGANPAQRWVALECGSVDGAQASSAPAGGGAAVNSNMGTVKPKPKPQGPKDGIPFYVLALSWEPAFCETMKGKAECQHETAASYEASHFALHGLWPQPRRNVFCGVDRATAALDDQHQWKQLPEPQLTPATKAALDKEVNSSAVQKFMAANIGKTIQMADLRAKFDEAFGKGAGDRVRVSCDKAGRFSELTIGLKGDIPSGKNLSDLIAASETTDAGCPSGLVDAVH
jgi:ribonuclease T2